MDNKVSVDYIAKLYNQYNKTYFDNSLPMSTQIQFLLTQDKCSIGYCAIGKNVFDGKSIKIALSEIYHEKYPEEIGDTLLHEMIHIRVPNHGKKFYSEMERIVKLGGSVTRYTKHSLRSEYARHQYMCTECKSIIRRMRFFKNLTTDYRCICGGSIEYINREEKS